MSRARAPNPVDLNLDRRSDADDPVLRGRLVDVRAVLDAFFADRARWLPEEPSRFHPERPLVSPSMGFCGRAARVVWTLLGGRMVEGEVRGPRPGWTFHVWNQLPDGRDVDLTGDQFGYEAVQIGHPGWSLYTPFSRMRRRYVWTESGTAKACAEHDFVEAFVQRAGRITREKS